MKRTKLQSLCASLLVAILALLPTESISGEANRAWMISACYKFRLAVWDKFDGEAGRAKYVITSDNGTVFIAERTTASGPNSSEVFFPDDFHDAKIHEISASVNCFYGEAYKWEVYVNDVLRDSGTIGFTRNKPRNVQK